MPVEDGHSGSLNRVSRDVLGSQALLTIVRMRHRQPTRDYVERRTAEGLSKRQIIRCLKRYTAREVFKDLPRPATVEPALPVTQTAA